MEGLKSNLLLHPWWLVIVFIVTAVLWLSLEVAFQFLFHRHLGALGYPLLRKVRFFGIRAWLHEALSAQVIGVTWFLRRRHWYVGVAAIATLVLTGWRAVESEQPSEFSRAGALVVIGGLLCIVIGHLEALKTKALWFSIKKSLPGTMSTPDLDDFIDEAVDGAQLYGILVSVLISIVGTLVWAYGDQVLSCELFPKVGIAPDEDLCFSP